MSVVIDYTNGLEIAPLGDKLGVVNDLGEIDLSTGSVFNFTPTVDTTFSFNNTPSSGSYSFSLNITGAVGIDPYNLTSVSKTQTGAVPGVTSMFGMTFKPDGTMIFITRANTISLYAYTLTTPWDVSTAQNEVIKSITGPTNLRAIYFKPDGTRVYISDNSTGKLYQFNLSTAWDISTISSAPIADLTSPGGNEYILGFKPDGTKFFWGKNSNALYQYTLSTPWNLSTAGTPTSNINLSSDLMYDAYISPDGTKIIALNATDSRVEEYALTTAWDITTLSTVVRSQTYTSLGIVSGSLPTAITFKDDGLQFYVGYFSSPYSIETFTITSTGGAPATFSFPGNIKWSYSVTPASPNSGETDSFIFSTTDGGLTWTGYRTGDNLS